MNLRHAYGGWSDDDALREKLAERGRTKVAAEFDIERSAKQLRDLFASTIC